jgi:murein DD-endopeptidase MepM/ murein hydrolase activator NlpD
LGSKIYNKRHIILLIREFLLLVDIPPKTAYTEDSGLIKLLKSEYFSLFFIFVISFTLLTTKGHGKEDQNIFFNNVLKGYIGESAAYYDPSPQNTVIDVNSLTASNVALGGEDNQYLLGTIQQNSLLSHGSVAGVLEYTESDRNEIITYTVQSGDVLSLIARDYGVSTNSLIWANNLKNANAIQLDQELKIPPVSGVIHTVASGDTVSSLASRYSADIEEIIEFNSLPADGSLSIGMDIVVPGGEITTIRSGTSTVRYAKTVPFANLPALIGYFFHPTGGAGRVSQWIHGRNAVDIAAPCGTPLYAAAGGNVVIATSTGWNGGYGRYVKISHPNGTATVYGHVWDVLVSAGQSVSKGQKVATVGSTGRSTGCHVHFETHGARNPITL